MNIVYLSPNFPPNYYQFLLGLRNLGVNVFGVGEENYEDISNELKYSLTEYYKVESMEDYDQLLRAVAFFTHKYGKIDRVFSLNEYWLEKEAMLRTDFNITGIKTDTIQTIKCKSKMKEKYIEAGVPVARGEVVHSVEQARKFIKKVGFPIVIKPDNGVGAANTFKISNDKDLESVFNRTQNNDLIMEEYIDGDLYSFDGLVDRDGKIVFCTSHYFGVGIMQAVNEKRDLFCYSLREIPADLKEAGEKTLKVFNAKETFFHLEYFRDYKSKKIVALEVNMRPPGGFVTDMFNFANDINIYQEWANVVVNNKFYSKYDRKYHCSFMGRRRGHKYSHSNDEIFSRYGKHIVMDTPMPEVFSGAMGNYAYLARHQDLQKILEIAQFVLE